MRLLEILRPIVVPVVVVLFVILSDTGVVTAQGGQDDAVQTGLPHVLDVRMTATPERARLVADLAARTEFAMVSLDKPNRIAIDVRAGAFFRSVPDEHLVADGIISEYTIEQVTSERVRTILFLSYPAQVQQAQLLDAVEGQPARLVIDIVPTTEDEFAANVARDSALSASVVDNLVPAVGSESVLTARPLIVIDPGHGGIDSGAEAANGVKEKDIVLAFSLRLQELLMEVGRFDVALTREDDSFLRLEERVALARANKADLFVSIHADSFTQPDVRGASVYMRDDRATDVLDKVLADNENRGDIIAGFVLPQTVPEVVDILIDLMWRETRYQSYIAAQAIVQQLESRVQLRRFPVRQADFFVLQAPDVPSVLIELGFISNADDAANLARSDWQDRTAAALTRGISTYFDSLALPD